MCGIAGFTGPGDTAVLDAMIGRLAHRGPDGAGHHHDGPLAVHLGHRRLSILDVAGGAQPMADAQAEIWVVFNGEIYNHRELRRQLEAAGHRFQTDHSDTEVLIHGYKEWGLDLPNHLNGMFAFAILDRVRRRLFLARDRFGEKPLFYSHGPGRFAFASELPALLAHPAVPRDQDPAAIRKFFAYALFPAPHTPYAAIRKLAAGGTMVVELDTGDLRLGRYWRFAVEPEETGRSEDDLARQLAELLSNAVAGRLESDVPLGILLSGGIDSSSVLALAAAHVDRDRLDCFSIGFQEASFDESDYARLAAGHFGARHHLEVCDWQSAQGELMGLLDRLGEPVGDSSILPTWLVSRFARSRVTVALGGDGADELFAGYDPFVALAPTAWYRRLVPGALHPALEALAGLLPQSRRNLGLDFKIQRWLRGAGHRDALWTPIWMGALGPDEIAQLFAEPVKVEDLYSEAIAQWDGATSPHPVDRASEFFANFYLTDGVLVKTDRASMLNSLEVRAPFLDNHVVDFARKLPHRYKFRGGQRKYLLKRAVRHLLPAAILDRRKKGFGIPLGSWLKGIDPLPLPQMVPGLDPRWLADRARLHRSGARDCRHGLWCGMALARSLDRE